MEKTTLNTRQLIEDIRSGKEGRDRVLRLLYKDLFLKNSIKGMLIKMGGSEDDFREVFTDTLMQFVKTVLNHKGLEIKSNVRSYITSIAKYIWLKSKSKDQRETSLDELEFTNISDDITPFQLVLKKDKNHHINQLLSQLGELCKEVLMHWANGYKMKEIAEMMHYKSEQMAKKKKHLCFKKLLSFVHANPEIKMALR